MKLGFWREANRPLEIHPWISAPFNVSPDSEEGVHDEWDILLVPSSFMTRDVVAYARRELFAYRIFAPWRMKAQVLTESGAVAPGAIILQRVKVGPVFVDMGVKVFEVFDDERGPGFSVVTLQGHLERGRETFVLMQSEKGLALRIEAWSGPGHPLAWVGRPLVRWMQKRFTAEGMETFALRCARAAQHHESGGAKAILRKA